VLEDATRFILILSCGSPIPIVYIGMGMALLWLNTYPAFAGMTLRVGHLFSHAVEGGVIKLNFSITIPDRLARFVIALTLLYRRARYGYAFRRIPLTQGKYAIVDPEDFERLNKHKWHAVKSANTFYVGRTIYAGKKHISIRMHRQILHPPDHLFVDHINHNGLDNRKANLRLATCAQNSYNRIYFRKSNSSKYTGVSWNKQEKKWAVVIGYNKKNKFIGYFKDEIQAAKAYDQAAKEYHGEFASLNFKE
jgi:hypothetical protein